MTRNTIVFGFITAALAGVGIAAIALFPYQITSGLFEALGVVDSMATNRAEAKTLRVGDSTDLPRREVDQGVLDAAFEDFEEEDGLALDRLIRFQGASEQTLERLEKLYEENPSEQRVALAYGKALLFAEQPRKAIGVFNAVLENDPDKTHVRGYLGVSQTAAGSYKEAIKVFRRIIKENPNDANAHNNLGIALLSRAQFEEAIDAFTTAVSIDPTLWTAHENLRLLFAKLERELPAEELSRYCAAPAAPKEATQVIHLSVSNPRGKAASAKLEREIRERLARPEHADTTVQVTSSGVSVPPSATLPGFQ